MREALQSFTEALCAANGPPPLFALLLVGNVRTFYEPRVYKSIRANLIDALGAPSVAFCRRLRVIDQKGLNSVTTEQQS